MHVFLLSPSFSSDVRHSCSHRAGAQSPSATDLWSGSAGPSSPVPVPGAFLPAAVGRRPLAVGSRRRAPSQAAGMGKTTTPRFALNHKDIGPLDPTPPT